MKVRIFHSGLTNRIFASTRYSERPGGLFVSSKKDDVTQDAIAAVLQHMDECTQQDCLCQRLDDRRMTPAAIRSATET